MVNGVLLLKLFLSFCLISLLSVGGANAAIPEIHRLVVETHHWLTDDMFAACFAISQAAPGPNVMLVTMIGWEVAGFWGAVVATIGVVLPACLLALVFFRMWKKWPPADWRQAIQAGLAPVTIGLVLSSGYLIAGSAGHSLAGVVLTVAMLLVALRTQLNPLWLFMVAAVLGAGGWV